MCLSLLCGVRCHCSLHLEHPTHELHDACLHAMKCQQRLPETGRGQLCVIGHGVLTLHLIYIDFTFSCLSSSACEHHISASWDYSLLQKLILKIINLVADLNFIFSIIYSFLIELFLYSNTFYFFLFMSQYHPSAPSSSLSLHILSPFLPPLL